MKKPKRCIILPQDIEFTYHPPGCPYCGGAQYHDEFGRCMNCSAPAQPIPTIIKVPRTITRNEIEKIRKIAEES